MHTILIVEDESGIRDIIEHMLKIAGYGTVMAENGVRAMEVAQQSRPNLILMDMGLPVMNGWEATRAIKNDRELQHIPVIALTAYALTEDRERCFAAGCDEYETKPFDFPRLLSKIRRLLQPAASPA